MLATEVRKDLALWSSSSCQEDATVCLMRGDLDSHPELDENYMFGFKLIGTIVALVTGVAVLFGFK